MKYPLIVIFSLLMIWGLSAQSQSQSLQIDPDFTPQISITGTSSLHDWKVTGSGILEVPSTIEMTPDDPAGIPVFGFKVPVDSMDGGRGSSMNNKIYAAFKSSENPFVTYQQTSPAQVNKKNNHELAVSSTGNLSMAGVQKTVTVSLNGIIEDGYVTFKGSKSLKMSDYDMIPPSAMFGQIKTHDDVVVHFEFRYLVNNE